MLAVSIPVVEKRRGRPPGEKYAPPVPIRLTAEQIVAVDEWRRHEPDLPSRSEAIRRLVEFAVSKAPHHDDSGEAN